MANKYTKKTIDAETWAKAIAFYKANEGASISSTSRLFRIPYNQVRNKFKAIGIHREAPIGDFQNLCKEHKKIKPGRLAKISFFK